MRPEFYPHRPARVEVKQTHMSYVFLADDFVYKIKKPVNFAFADCSKLDSRYLLCCDEVRLNRRLAPEIYLGVAPIFARDGKFVLGEEDQVLDHGVQEYAVKMRRLPDERMLDRAVRSGEVTGDLINSLAKRLAGFHRGASTAAAWRYGSAPAIWRTVFGNLKEIERFAGYTATDFQIAAIKDYLKRFINAHWELFNDRLAQGRVREGHGDLRCEHVCLIDGIQIFDCLEFSEPLRYGDVAADLAFLAMDLDALDAPYLADDLITAYANETSDEALATLITFYKCYRACVRGKVESLKSLENEVPPPQREAACESAHGYFSLAHRYALRGRPALVIVCGLAGTGKSTMSRILRNRTGFEILSSDRTRKRLAEAEEITPTTSTYGAGIYSPAFDRLTYDRLLADAQARLRDGRGVIIDATFKRLDDRRRALAIGAQAGVPVLFIECQAEEREVVRRLHERTKKGDSLSDATAEVYLSQRVDFAPITEVRARHHLVVDTGAPRERTLDSIESALRDLFHPDDHAGGG